VTILTGWPSARSSNVRIAPQECLSYTTWTRSCDSVFMSMLTTRVGVSSISIVSVQAFIFSSATWISRSRSSSTSNTMQKRPKPHRASRRLTIG
jgi:hypothetical protein